MAIEPTGDSGTDRQPLLLTDVMVAELLSLSRRTVWRLVPIGELPQPIKIGRASRWRYADIRDCVEEIGCCDDRVSVTPAPRVFHGFMGGCSDRPKMRLIP